MSAPVDFPISCRACEQPADGIDEDGVALCTACIDDPQDDRPRLKLAPHESLAALEAANLLRREASALGWNSHMAKLLRGNATILEQTLTEGQRSAARSRLAQIHKHGLVEADRRSLRTLEDVRRFIKQRCIPIFPHQQRGLAAEPALLLAHAVALAGDDGLTLADAGALVGRLEGNVLANARKSGVVTESRELLPNRGGAGRSWQVVLYAADRRQRRSRPKAARRGGGS